MAAILQAATGMSTDAPAFPVLARRERASFIQTTVRARREGSPGHGAVETLQPPTLDTRDRPAHEL